MPRPATAHATESDRLSTSQNCAATSCDEVSTRRDRSPLEYLRLFALVAAVGVLLGLSVVRTYSLGQHERMYDNPIYRWRESLVIALSRMQTPPLHGYLAYRSILDYLTGHGLAIVAGEAEVLSTPEQRRALVTDGSRMNQLIQEASRVPINVNLEPVILKGNELGLADFFYAAFRLFGLNLNALVLFYYSVLFISVLVFFLAFRHSPFCLLLLMLYLIGHYFAVDYATMSQIQVIHNSRFFPVLSLLPAMHLLLLLLRREPASLANILFAVIQASILFFVIFCRGQALWQVLAVLASVVLVIRFRDVRTFVRLTRQNVKIAVKQVKLRRLTRKGLKISPTTAYAVPWSSMIRAASRDIWPALVVLCGLVGLWLYAAVAPDSRFYRAESGSHFFWHTFYIGLISADPELTSIYGMGEEPYTDTMGYMAALQDLRGRNEATSEVADVADGVININFLKNGSAYESIMRRVFFQVVFEKPWATLRSFLLGKPIDQYDILTHVPPLWEAHLYVEALAIAFGASLLALFAGAGIPSHKRLPQAAVVLILLVSSSLITTFIVPTALIPDVIVFYLMLGLLLTTYLPLALVFWVLNVFPTQQRAQTSASSPLEFEHGIAGSNPIRHA
jgi:hypothetical protein